MHALHTINRLNADVSLCQELLKSHVEISTQSGTWVSGEVVDAFISSRTRETYVCIRPDRLAHAAIIGEWFSTWRLA